MISLFFKFKEFVECDRVVSRKNLIECSHARTEYSQSFQNTFSQSRMAEKPNTA